MRAGRCRAVPNTLHPLWTTLLCALLPLGASLGVVRIEAERLQAVRRLLTAVVHVHGTMALMLPNNGQRK